MKAIILNSGIGKRMGELTRDIPKCLVDIGGGETILSHQVDFLATNGVTDIIITTGPFPEKIKSHLESRFAGSLHGEFSGHGEESGKSAPGGHKIGSKRKTGSGESAFIGEIGNSMRHADGGGRTDTSDSTDTADSEDTAETASALRFTYVRNPLYETTNYIYSLHLTAPLFSGSGGADGGDDGILLMHGDLVFDAAVPDELIRTEHENAVLVDAAAKLPEKDFKCRLQDGLVKEIGVNLFGPDCRFLVPMYKLSAKTYKKWLAEIATFVEAGKTGVYAEDALNKLLKEEIELHPVYYSEEFCSEIDDTEDLERARKRKGDKHDQQMELP